MFCPYCGTNLAEGSAFCSTCGRSLASAPRAAATPAAEPDAPPAAGGGSTTFSGGGESTPPPVASQPVLFGEGPRNPYPLRVDVPYELFASRAAAFFRLILFIPAAAFIYTVQQASQLLGFFAGVAVVFTGHYPNAMWRFNFTYANWIAQFWAYLALITDDYPELGPGAHTVRVHSAPFDGPDGQEDSPPERSSRWRALLRIFLVVPQFIVVFFVNIAGFVVVILQWFAVLVTGHRPEGLTSFLSAVLRWNTRLTAYTLLVRDEYPPYSGAADAETTGRQGETTAFAVGLLFAAGIGGVVALSIANQPEPLRYNVAYEDAAAGDRNSILEAVRYEPTVADGNVDLYFTGGGADPAPDEVRVKPGHRLVTMVWRIDNETDAELSTETVDMWVVADGEDIDAFEVRIDGRRNFPIPEGDSAYATGFFEVPDGAHVTQFTFAPFFGAQDIEINFSHQE